MRRTGVLVTAGVAGFALASAAFLFGAARAADEPLIVVVTDAGDAPDASCGEEGACTLRAAIVLANDNTDTGDLFIHFSNETFPVGETVIDVAGEPLPALTRPNTHVDTGGRAIVIDGSALAGDVDGLALHGASNTMRGLHLRGFGGRCLVLAGAAQSAREVTVSGCATGIHITGTGSSVAASSVSDSETGVAVLAGEVTIGGATAADGNTIGNTILAIRVGGPSAPFAGVVIANNRIGTSGDGANAPVAVGVQLRTPNSGTRVESNHFQNTTLAGIQVVPSGNGAESSGNTFRGNHFAVTSGMAIDLGADGVRNPNNEPPGPNAGVHHPVIARATQGAISGSAGGGCGGCTIELYAAHHEPGGTKDYGAAPITSVTANASGDFAIASPPVAPGDWLTALTTDANGNTSEFGASARVGDGVAQCGNVTLRPGWNHAGYFGSAPLSLTNGISEPGFDAITTIYKLDDGADSYRRWFADAPFASTLTTLEPGQSYWFYAERTVSLPSGFALNVGLPVALKPGWNDFIYIGGEADPRDALSSIAGHHGAVYHWTNSDVGHWTRWVPDAPSYVDQFNHIESCSAYLVEVDAAVTLTPLQP